MKKKYNTIKIFFVLLCTVSIKMSAQLSGLYTINSGSPSSVSNFTSFTDFCTIYNSLGVTGAVTVNVVANSGPYTEQITLNQATGSSATNSLVINGNSCTIQFNSSNSAAPWTINCGGVDYMTINDLNIVGLGTTYAMTLKLWNNSTYNNFNNCNITVPLNMTSTNIIPVSISATNNSYSSSGVLGQNNYNTWTGCTIVGGYFGVTVYGYTGSPYTLGNNFTNCVIKDFYVYGMYNYYHYGFTIKGCTIERPNAATISTFYGIYLSGTTIPLNGAINVDGNRIRYPFGTSNTGNTNTLYGIYPTMSGANATDCINLKNNLISDLYFNGGMYAIYCTSYSFINVLHNTISMDDPNSTYTGTSYALYYYGTGGIVKNNLITCNRAGTGTKYGFFYASTVGTGIAFANGNCGSYKPTISNAFPYYHFSFGGFQTAATWSASSGLDLSGSSADPGYVNPTAGNYLPTSYAVNDLGVPVGVTTDILNTSRSLTTPDPGAFEFLNIPCSGAPALANVVTPTTVVCPGASVNIGLSTTYTNNGLQFLWQSSTTSSVGPFTAVSGASLQAFTTPTLSTATWYQVVVTCTNGPNTTAANAGLVQIAGVTTSQIPYFEGFEGITRNNTLPNCSWAASNMSTTCLTYTAANLTYRLPRTGSRFASFYYNPGGTLYFWTNGIQMNAGITYSAAVWYLTEALQGYNNWSELSIIINTVQTATGASTIATTGNAAIALVYKLLSSTYTVGSSGLYYIGIKAIGNTASAAQYLSWDDLAITIPCAPGVNQTNLSIAATNTSICAGLSAGLTASGADTYTWSTGNTGAVLTNSPGVSTLYSVVGTSTLTGCTNTAVMFVNVKPTPVVSIISTFPPAVCSGKPYSMLASGANSYQWNNGSSNALLVVNPTSSISYSVIGTTNGCSSSASQFINVNPSPAVSIGSSNGGLMCQGENGTLIGSSQTPSLSFVWTSNSGLTIQSANAVIAPFATTTYVLTGTDANGCQGTASITVVVDPCTGLKNVSSSDAIQVYPNPTSSEVNLKFNNSNFKTIEVIDVTGRVIGSSSSNEETAVINLNNLANGIYSLKIQTSEKVTVLKVVKQ